MLRRGRASSHPGLWAACGVLSAAVLAATLAGGVPSVTVLAAAFSGGRPGAWGPAAPPAGVRRSEQPAPSSSPALAPSLQPPPEASGALARVAGSPPRRRRAAVLRPPNRSRSLRPPPHGGATPTPSPPPPDPTPSPSPSQAPGVLLSDDFESYPSGQRWEEGSVHGPWRTVFTGYGTVGIVSDGTNLLSLSPLAATEPAETHAALVASAASFADLDLRVRMSTVRQLRGGAANPWEVAWLLWRYADPTHFYYLALKPNGWELGKEDPAYPGAQRFLATGSDVVFPVGRLSEVRIRQRGAVIEAWADGRLLTSFTDTERPYLKGAVALYTEDAEARFDDLLATAP